MPGTASLGYSLAGTVVAVLRRRFGSCKHEADFLDVLVVLHAEQLADGRFGSGWVGAGNNVAVDAMEEREQAD